MNLRRLKDLTERVVLTFVGAFIAVYLAAFAAGESDIAFLRDPGLFDKAKTAGIAATVPLVAGLLGFRVGDKSTASVIPSNKPGSEPDAEPGVELNVTPLQPGEILNQVDTSEKFVYWYKEEGA